MRFKLVETGKSYAEAQESAPAAEVEVITDQGRASVPPIIWETGNIAQIRSLLVLREAELVVAKARLTGKDWVDCYIKNRILDLEIKVADLRRWLVEAMEKRGH